MRKKALVTGSAGFIGSHLCEALVRLGWEIIGVDCFTDYYEKVLKEKNLANLRLKPNFTFVEKDLTKDSLTTELKDVDFVFHQAGQPGVRGSWGANFNKYLQNNILATQYLLEIIKDYDIKKFIFASSSSIYGNTGCLPMKESQIPQPYSPYGVSKLAAEQLCLLYHENYRVPTIALRYFTVYGPRQRPEMAISSFIKTILEGKPISIYGDGNQRRDFTYVEDIIQANLLAAESSLTGEVFNVGGGKPEKLIDVVRILEQILNKKVLLSFSTKRKGDVRDTFADISKIQENLGFIPSYALEEGLVKQVACFIEESNKKLTQ